LVIRRSSVILAVVVALALAAGCGGGDKPTKTVTVQDTVADTPPSSVGLTHRKPAGAKLSSDPAGDYARAMKAVRGGDYDTAIAIMKALGGYRDARSQLARIKVVGARHKLAVARRKLRTAPSPQSAVALAKTSLKYHPTPEARAFLRQAQAVHDRYKKRQAKGLEER
jgi:hypothetical protein